MHKKLNSHVQLSLLAAAIALTAAATNTLAANPFITSIYTADPSAHVWSDGRLYLYPSRDIDPARGCDLMDHYHVFSTEDMVNWRDEGEILNSSQVSWGRPEGGFMWAPDCAFHKGTYYYYFPHPSGTEWNKTWKIGVASSKKPASDFKPLNYIGGLDGNSMIDPCVFIDTDGQPYLYYGGGGKCKGGKLKDNMTEVDESSMTNMVGLVDFHEATWVFKRKNTYYLTYADNHPHHNRMQYATSSSPLGPWTPKGVYLDETDCDTTHGSVVEYKGQWYQFYHNQSLSGHGNLRSVCVDKLNFNDDGTIQMVTQTKTGVASVGPAPKVNPNTVRLTADSAILDGEASLVEDSAASDGKTIQNMHLTEPSFKWTNVDGGKNGGRATIDIYYGTADNSKLRLKVNDVDYTFINTPPTSGWSDYTGHSYETVMLKPGNTNVIKFTGGNWGVNVDHASVTPLD